MEIQLNKDLNACTEEVLMGMDWRQTIGSIVGCGISIAVYFLGKNSMGTELTTWICILAVLPCAAFGFIRYHGLPFERLIAVWIRQYICLPEKLLYVHENRNYMEDRSKIDLIMKEEAKKHD